MSVHETQENPPDLHTYSDLERANGMEIERTGAMLDHAEACAKLWIAVIRRAANDLDWLRSNPARRVNRRNLTKRNAIKEYDPEEFFAGPRFDEVCRLIGVPTDLVLCAHGLERPAPNRGQAA